MNIPLLAGLGPQELIVIVIVLVLLFGAKKLPELARGTGQALRIFKAETKALQDGDEKPAEGGADAPASTATPTTPTAGAPVVDPAIVKPEAQNVTPQPEPEHRTDTTG